MPTESEARQWKQASGVAYIPTASCPDDVCWSSPTQFDISCPKLAKGDLSAIKTSEVRDSMMIKVMSVDYIRQALAHSPKRDLVSVVLITLPCDLMHKQSGNPSKF